MVHQPMTESSLLPECGGVMFSAGHSKPAMLLNYAHHSGRADEDSSPITRAWAHSAMPDKLIWQVIE